MSRQSIPVTETTLGLLLRLDRVTNDGVGWMATFFGKPDCHGNHLSVPISPEHAEELRPGKQYLFVLAGEAA